MLKEIVNTVECQKLINGRLVKSEARVIMERELPILINGEHLVTASVTPDMEKEFVTGYLLGQGFIDNIEELKSIDIEDNTARVTIKGARWIASKTKKTEYRIVSGGGKTVFFDETSLPQIHSKLTAGKKDIFKAMNTVMEKAAIYQETEGVHATGLFTPEAVPICTVEDIGRHNTLDKVIGYALINKIDFGNTFLASTGRMTSEMVAKLCRAGIPIAVTKTAVTKTGLEIGQKCGLTIIGFVRDTGTQINTDMEIRTIIESGMKIYTYADRITLG
jgi:FdhD protein